MSFRDQLHFIWTPVEKNSMVAIVQENNTRRANNNMPSFSVIYIYFIIIIIFTGFVVLIHASELLTQTEDLLFHISVLNHPFIFRSARSVSNRRECFPLSLFS